MSRTGLKRHSSSANRAAARGGKAATNQPKKARSSSQAQTQGRPKNGGGNGSVSVSAKAQQHAFARRINKGRDEEQRSQVDRQLSELKTRTTTAPDQRASKLAAERNAKKVQPRERDELMRTFEKLMS